MRLHYSFQLTKEECRLDDRCGPMLRDLEANPETAHTLDLLTPPASLDPVTKFQALTRGDCVAIQECADAFHHHHARPDIFPEVILRSSTTETTAQLNAKAQELEQFEGINYLAHYWAENGESIIANSVLLLLLLTAVSAFYYLYWKPKKEREAEAEKAKRELYGSAAWMSLDEGEAAGIAGANASGLLVGTHSGGQPLRYPGQAHVLTFAPTGSGKGVSAIIPNLLEYDGSIMCIDPKGENAAVTARYRRETLHQQVYLLDPWELVTDDTATFNPLQWIDPDSPDFEEDCMMLADTLVPPSGGADSHWDKEAKSLIAGMIMLVVLHEEPEDMHLPRVYEFLSRSSEDFRALIREMMNSPNTALAQAGNRFDQKNDREGPAVISSALANLHFLSSSRMRKVLATSTFDPMRIKKEKMTVYLILPPDRLDTMSPWLRLMIAMTLTSFSRDKTVPDKQVLFLLDEFASLGHLEKVKTAMGLMRGYGVKLWPILQDLGQLQAIYPKAWKSFVANAGAIQVFGTNDPDTAEYFSKKAGTKTVEEWKPDKQGGGDFNRFGRRLIMADEIMRLDSQQQLLFLQSMKPIQPGKAHYLDMEYLNKRADKNPYYK